MASFVYTIYETPGLVESGSRPGWLGPLRTAFRGVPVLDWLGNPTVRWTYRSRQPLVFFLMGAVEVNGGHFVIILIDFVVLRIFFVW